MSNAQDRLRLILAFAYLGKRAYMDGNNSEDGWHEYFAEVNSPDGVYGMDGLAEAAFDGLLRMACEVWQMLNEPEDVVEGQHIDRTQAPAPAGGE